MNPIVFILFFKVAAAAAVLHASSGSAAAFLPNSGSAATFQVAGAQVCLKRIEWESTISCCIITKKNPVQSRGTNSAIFHTLSNRMHAHHYELLRRQHYL